MWWNSKKGGKDSHDPRRSIKVYPDGSISVDPAEIMRQYREQFRYSGQSALSTLDEEGASGGVAQRK